MEIRLLGPLEVLSDGRMLELGGGRHRALLGVLALHPNEVVSADRLIESLWGDAPPPTAGKALQNQVSRLRRALEPVGEVTIETRAPGYVLKLEVDAIDVRRFERLAGEGRRLLESDPEAAATTLRGALALWRGEPLAEFAYEPFAQAEIARLDELRLETLEDRIEADLALGVDSVVISELQTLVDANPLRERLVGQLMLALYRSGRQADALEAYRELREALDRDLGLEPGPALRRLEQSILTQDPALGPGARPPRLRPAKRRGRALAIAVAALIAAVAGAVALVARGADAPIVVPDSLVKIDARSNEIVDVIPVGRDPGQVEVVGRYVFVASQADATLHRVDPRSGAVTTSGATAADGALTSAGPFLWVTSVKRSEVVRIHGETQIAGERLRLRPDLAHAFVAVGGGSLWISEYPQGAVSRWRLRTLELERRYDLGPAEFPVEVTWAHGAAWVGLGFSNELLRIDGETGRTRRIQVGLSPSDPVSGFGSIWTGSVDDEAVWRVDALSERTTATVATGRVGFGLAVGAGSVWVSNYCDGTVSRIDPSTNTVVATIETGYYPKWLTVGDGFVFVGVSGTKLSFNNCS